MASKKQVEETVIDLSEQATNGKITEDEVGAIRTIRNRSAEITLKIGQLRLEQVRVQTRLAQVTQAEVELLEEYGRLVQQEQDTFKSLSDKYGQGSLDLDTGTFTPLQESTD